GDDHQVRLARRGTKHLRTEARYVETRGAHRHHLDGAAGQAEAHRPDGIPAHPVHHGVHRGHNYALVLLLAESSAKDLATALFRASQVVEALTAGLGVLEMGRLIVGTHRSYYTHHCLRCPARAAGRNVNAQLNGFPLTKPARTVSYLAGSKRISHPSFRGGIKTLWLILRLGR